VVIEIRRLSWLGTRTERHDDTVAFFRDVLGLEVRQSGEDFTILEVPGGASLEVFGPRCPYNRHLTYPVAGFLVADLDSALADLQAGGTEIVLPRQEGDTGAWFHFRAPDGFVYELTEEWADQPPGARTSPRFGRT
jgi:catechol 2,3-dioxygenase-like lactoylglutathione lyase family enzyme